MIRCAWIIYIYVKYDCIIKYLHFASFFMSDNVFCQIKEMFTYESCICERCGKAIVVVLSKKKVLYMVKRSKHTLTRPSRPTRPSKPTRPSMTTMRPLWMNVFFMNECFFLWVNVIHEWVRITFLLKKCMIFMFLMNALPTDRGTQPIIEMRGRI